MGIKTFNVLVCYCFVPLKNLPTTWGLRLNSTTKGCFCFCSEKPPHHMGIKTWYSIVSLVNSSLKNLPTTWGLRPRLEAIRIRTFSSEKPPHHMGIKTAEAPAASAASEL